MNRIAIFAFIALSFVTAIAQVNDSRPRADQPSSPVTVKLTLESLITAGLSPDVKKIVTETYTGDFYDLNGDADATGWSSA